MTFSPPDIFRVFDVLLTGASDLVRLVFILVVAWLFAPFVKYATKRESLWDAIRKHLKLDVTPPHFECSWHNGIIEVNYARVAWREAEVTWKSRYLHDAMTYADTFLDIMRTKFLDIYRRRLVEIGVPSLDLDEEYDYYSHVIDRLVHELRQRGRRYFRENGYPKMTKEQIAEYLESRTASMLANGTEVLDIFHRSRVVPRPSLRDLNAPYMPELSAAIRKTFEVAIAASTRWNDDRKRLYTIYHEAHMKAYGKPPAEPFEA